MKRDRQHVLVAGFAAGLSMTAAQPAPAQDTCRQGYVWREAYHGDHVCAETSAGAPPASAYNLSAWSAWSRTAGVEYRYRWGP